MLHPSFFHDLTKPHEARNPWDRRSPQGFQSVRVDGGDSHTNLARRVYSTIRAGFGEGARAKAAKRRYDQECIAEVRSLKKGNQS